MDFSILPRKIKSLLRIYGRDVSDHSFHLCDLIEMLPAHEDIALWKEMVSTYAYQYLKEMTAKNSFGRQFYALFTGKDPGGSRKTGSYWYRYFMQPELSWWVGINSNLASTGVGLMKASKSIERSGT